GGDQPVPRGGLRAAFTVHQYAQLMEIVISADPSRLDIPLIHRFLTEESYWAKGIPLETVERSIRNSMAFGVYDGDRQVGFARVITDRATFGYLADVFILPEYRGRGLAGRLVREILAHPELNGLRRWMLATADAHGVYRKAGFGELAKPERFMEISDPDIYSRVQR
ncbi:MAG TPA: GNAT family N-acetyltransferase, partial [Sphingobacteriaceae bacterium]